jgi:hypothetical protein
MTTNRDNETLGEYWERTHPSFTVYARIDRVMTHGFVGLLVAGMSPIIGDAFTGWIGWPVFIAGACAYIYAMFAIGRIRGGS